VGAGHAVAAAGAYPVGVARGGAGARAIETGAAGAEDQAEGGRGFLRQALPAALGLWRAQEPGWQDAGPGDGCADLRALAGAEAEVPRRRQWHRTLAPAVRGAGVVPEGAQGEWAEQRWWRVGCRGGDGEAGRRAGDAGGIPRGDQAAAR